MKFEIQDLRHRYDNLCMAEDRKDKLIADLFENIDELVNRLSAREDEVDNQKRLVASFRDESRKYKNELDCVRRDQGKLSFVSVLVDGDGMNFLPTLVRDGEKGGDRAGRALIESVKAHVQMTDPDVPPNTCYKIRVYANVEGLTKAYRGANVLHPSQDLGGFIQGFNKSDALCDFVDVGQGKECCDAKLRDIFEKDINDIHCRRVVFCASADDGYAPVLRPRQGVKPISLVEGPPFARAMKDLSISFDTTSFENIFMTDKLKPRKASFGPTTTPPTTPTPTPNYALAAKTPSLQQTLAPTTRTLGQGLVKPTLSVCVNSQGERVDRPLRISPKETINSLKSQKLCNVFHILGPCPYTGCAHEHGPALGSQELIDLIFIARATPCYTGLACRDIDCISGHRCTFGEKCFYSNCRFDDSMHEVDTVITRTVDEYVFA
ncbi:CCCH zinc finger DNA binding protein [Aspergillus californicus]